MSNGNAMSLAMLHNDEANEAASWKCYMVLHNLSNKKGCRFDIGESEISSGPKEREEWTCRLTVNGKTYQGDALKKQSAKDLAAKKALDDMKYDFTAVAKFE